jgi:hypothetical protein
MHSYDKIATVLKTAWIMWRPNEDSFVMTCQQWEFSQNILNIQKQNLWIKGMKNHAQPIKHQIHYQVLQHIWENYV